MKRPVLYRQITQNLLHKIQSGVWAVGENLPSEQYLCKDLGVSRQTVRHALKSLQDSGHIHRQQGAPTIALNWCFCN